MENLTRRRFRKELNPLWRHVLAGAGVLDPPVFQLQRLTSVTIPDNAWTAVTWSDAHVLRDDFNIHTPGGGDFTNLTIPVGLYLVTGAAYFADDADGSRGFDVPAVPGLVMVSATEHDIGKDFGSFGFGGPLWQTQAFSWQMTTVFQNSGGPLDLEYCEVQMFQLKEGDL